ncbi:MAG: hypothetical protein JSW14_06070 [Candidatus Bathyarchaeum sp.]|nr:MAG: hypothetical protein JSW14_06070 [Candidatus Bathyarchaeum sp.]
MPFDVKTFTLFPAFLLFVLSALLAYMTLEMIGLSARKTLLTVATAMFFGGLFLVGLWIVAGIVRRGSQNL